MKRTRQPVYWFIVLMAVFSISTYLHDFLKDYATSDFNDVAHYYSCSVMLRHGYNVWAWDSPEMLAQGKELVKSLPVKSNPFYRPFHSGMFFLFFMPFSLLPYKFCVAAWLLVTNVAFFAGIILLIRYFDEKIVSWKSLAALYLILQMWPLREEMHFGQPNILIFFLLSASLYFFKKHRYVCSGLSLAFAVGLKEIVFFVLFFHLWQRNWRVFISSVAGILCFKGISVFVFGIDKELSFLRYHFQSWLVGFIPEVMSISFNEVLHRVIGGRIAEAGIKIVLLGIGLALSLYMVFCLRRSPRPLPVRLVPIAFSLFLLFSLLVSPWLRETHLVLMSLPILAVWFYIDESVRLRVKMLFAAGYLLLGLKYSVLSFAFSVRGWPAVFCGIKTYACVLFVFLLGALLSRKQVYFEN